jgi:prolyl oligopeptidase
MRRITWLALPLLLAPIAAYGADAADPFAWLEDVLGERALGWVKEQNAQTVAVLEKQPEFEPV